ncbi:aspartate kinase, partial [Mammaliicoccus vitulinus]
IGVQTKAMTGYQAGIKTVGHHLKSKIAEIDALRFETAFETNDILVVAGFQGVNDHLEITTLGRGGSDTTAVAIAASIDTSCEIYTDVEGVYGTDPRIYKEAKLLNEVSYEEMMEMSALGAGVLESRSVEIAKNYNTPLYLGRTLSNVKGTWIMPQTEILEKKAVTGVALDKHMIHVTLTYPMQNFALLQNLFDALEEQAMNVDMISQIENQQGLQLSFTIKDSEVVQIEQIIESLTEDYPHLRYKMKDNYAKLSVIGTGMRDMSGIASKAFRTLISHDIRFYQTTTSEISISYVVDRDLGETAVRTLSEAFNI